MFASQGQQGHHRQRQRQQRNDHHSPGQYHQSKKRQRPKSPSDATSYRTPAEPPSSNSKDQRHIGAHKWEPPPSSKRRTSDYHSNDHRDSSYNDRTQSHNEHRQRQNRHFNSDSNSMPSRSKPPYNSSSKPQQKHSQHQSQYPSSYKSYHNNRQSSNYSTTTRRREEHYHGNSYQRNNYHNDKGSGSWGRTNYHHQQQKSRYWRNNNNNSSAKSSSTWGKYPSQGSNQDEDDENDQTDTKVNDTKKPISSDDFFPSDTNFFPSEYNNSTPSSTSPCTSNSRDGEKIESSNKEKDRNSTPSSTSPNVYTSNSKNGENRESSTKEKDRNSTPSSTLPYTPKSTNSEKIKSPTKPSPGGHSNSIPSSTSPYTPKSTNSEKIKSSTKITPGKDRSRISLSDTKQSSTNSLPGKDSYNTSLDSNTTVNETKRLSLKPSPERSSDEISPLASNPRTEQTSTKTPPVKYSSTIVSSSSTSPLASTPKVSERKQKHTKPTPAKESSMITSSTTLHLTLKSKNRETKHPSTIPQSVIEKNSMPNTPDLNANIIEPDEKSRSRISHMDKSAITTPPSTISSKESITTSTISSKTENLNTQKKNRKPPNPFRVRAKCVVAVRYNRPSFLFPDNEEKNKNDDTMNLWVEPEPGRDQGLALIGRQIRCVFPKSVMKSSNGTPKKEKKNNGDDDKKGTSTSKTTRIIEGEVISILNWKESDYNFRIQNIIDVHLLVDQKNLEHAPFLSFVEKDNDDNVTDKEKNRRKIERQIRGVDKVVVKVRLGDCNREVNDGHDCQELIARWRIQKSVPIHLGLNDSEQGEVKKTDDNSRFVGDANDEINQQTRNWEWVARDSILLGKHYLPDLRHGGDNAMYAGTSLVIGEVVSVEKPTYEKSLRSVILKKLYLPEHTHQGRQSHHGTNEVFEDAEDEEIEENVTYQIPIEDLIVIHGSLNRLSSDSMNLPHMMTSRYTYNFRKDIFYPRGMDAKNEVSTIDMKIDSSRGHCYHCKRACLQSEMRKCSSEFCQSDPSEIGKDTKEWCSACLRSLRERGVFTLYQDKNCWKCPCCVGVYDSSDLESCREAVFKKETLKSGRLLLATNNESSDASGSGKENGNWCSVCSRKCNNYNAKCVDCGKTAHRDCRLQEIELFHKTHSKIINQKINTEALSKKERKKLKKREKKRKSTKRCYQCLSNKLEYKLDQRTSVVQQSSHQILDCTTQILQKFAPCDFFFAMPTEISPLVQLTEHTTTPQQYVGSLNKTQKSPHKAKKQSITLDKKSTTGAPPSSSRKRRKNSPINTPPEKIVTSEEQECDKVFKPTCCRAIPISSIKKSIQNGNNSADHARRAVASARVSSKNSSFQNEREKGKAKADAENKGKSSRAARASQRRLLKDIALFGQSSFGVKEKISGSEQALRFGKSVIHGWGVFTDEDIKSGALIVEYRGVLIGNAVADKREEEYEKAKIGSDYMFRIDSNIVCDATHQGNVARFINASCTPNCYTQIITVNGVKRIVIYAKRDIRPGEELCYDYKFEAEFDEEKRIPCNCGDVDCRGFLNWDKRFVAIPKVCINAKS